MKILYHFTANQHIAKIRAEGLTKGIFPHHIDPATDRVISISGFQWLTRESSFEQPWALLGQLPMSKTGWRITVGIPLEWQRKLVHWPALVKRINPQCADDFNLIPGNTDWYIYRGRIPPAWFVAIDRNLGETMKPDVVGNS